MPLDIRTVESAKCPKDKAMKVFFDGDGLCLRVTRTQKKSWIIQYQLNKKRNNISIGSFPEITLAKARIERIRIKQMVAEGRDPKIAKDIVKANVLGASLQTVGHIFKAVTKERIASKSNEWSESHVKRNGFTWKHLKPIADVPIAELTKKRLRELLVSISQGIGVSTGEKCKWLMSSIYNYAVLNDIISKNLVSDFAKDPELRKRDPDDYESHPPIPFDRLGEIYTLFNSSGMTHVTKYALFCLQYTALRVNSLLASRWEDYDETKKLLRIHKEFVKNKKLINCPVIKEMADMFDVLEKQQQINNNQWDLKCFIFSYDGKAPIDNETPNNAVKRLLLKHQVGFRAVPHGFRNTCETHWVKSEFMQTAINVQSDHKSTTGDLVRDRYISKDEDFFKERTMLLESMAKLIKDAMSDYALLQTTIKNAKGSSPIMATSDTIDAT